MMRGQSLKVQLTDQHGNPITVANVMIEVHLFCNERFCYAFNGGRTNKDGNLTVTYDDLEGQRKTNGLLFLMDYNTKLEDCDSKMGLRILTQAELLLRRKNALNQFGQDPSWVSDWPSNVKVDAQPVTAELQDRITLARILCTLAETD
jgi:hypothetical protein